MRAGPVRLVCLGLLASAWAGERPAHAEEDRPRSFPRPYLRAFSPTFSADGSTLVYGRADGTVRVFDTATGKETRALRGPSGPLVLSPDGKLLAALDRKHDPE